MRFADCGVCAGVAAAGRGGEGALGAVSGGEFLEDSLEFVSIQKQQQNEKCQKPEGGFETVIEVQAKPGLNEVGWASAIVDRIRM